jgi:hypothetical protein
MPHGRVGTADGSCLRTRRKLPTDTAAGAAVAKLDRIARDAELVLRLSREAAPNGMGGFLFCDLPKAIDGNTK